MSKNFKPSMFNRVIRTGYSTVVYNSYMGTKSIIQVFDDDENKVNSLLSLPKVEIDDKSDGIAKELIERGILVPFDADEKARREKLMIESIFSNDLYLVIHTTENCNFRCEYCALNFHKRNLEVNTQEKIIKFIRKNIRFFNRVIIDWFGGEPLLNISAIEYISEQVKECCLKAHKQYIASVTTNGYLLTPVNVKKLLKANVFKICVTIDGIQETHDKQRHLSNGMPTFEKIINNLINIRNDKSLTMMDIVIRTNISLEISQKLEKYYIYYNELFGNDRRFSLFIRLVGDWGGSRIDNFKKSLIERSSYKYIYNKLMNCDGKIIFRNNFSDLEPAGCVCSAVYRNKYTIDVLGNIHKCDTPLENGKIGYIDDAGKMILNEDQHYKWISPFREKSVECDNCFFSCACFMLTCPKKRVVDCDNSCGDFLSGIDELILMYNNSIQKGVI